MNAPQKKRQGVGASLSVLLCYLHPVKLVFDRYPNKDKRDALGGILITPRDVIRVTSREQLYIFMKHEDFVTMNFTSFRIGLESSYKVLRSMPLKIVNIRRRGRMLRLNIIPVRLLFL